MAARFDGISEVFGVHWERCVKGVTNDMSSMVDEHPIYRCIYDTYDQDVLLTPYATPCPSLWCSPSAQMLSCFASVVASSMSWCRLPPLLNRPGPADSRRSSTFRYNVPTVLSFLCASSAVPSQQPLPLAWRCKTLFVSLDNDAHSKPRSGYTASL